MLIPAVLVLLIGAAEGGSFALLIPLADGIAENSFDFLHRSRAFGWVARLLPPSLLESPARDAYLAALIIALIFLGRFAKLGLEYVRKLYLDRRNERYRVLVRQETFARVLRFGRQYFDRQALGRIDTEVGWSTAVVDLLAAAEGVFLNLFRLVIKAGLLLAISLPLSITILVAFPLIQFFLRRIDQAARRMAEEASEVERRLKTEVLDLLTTIPLVKAYSQEDQAARAYGHLLDESRGLEIRRQRIRHLKNPVEEGVILMAVLVVEGLTLWWSQDFRPGDLARLGAFLLVAQQCLPDYMALSSFRLKIFETLPLLEALARLFQDEGKYIVASGDRPFQGLRKGISLRHLTFAYQPGMEVLHNVTADIPAGQITALVGESGAGKTTLVDLIARFYECPPATIFLDDIDIREFSLPSLHQGMAVVSQDVWLLNRSVRENLLFGRDNEPGDDALMQILAEVQLDELVTSLPAGLDTEIGDRGVQLSGGQRQRLALARALLRDPEILILDEATSALDSVLEQRLEETIEERIRGRTLLVIAHRLSTVRNADQILVMDRGRIVERGNWAELITAGGVFTRLYEAQFGGAAVRAGPLREEGAP